MFRSLTSSCKNPFSHTPTRASLPAPHRIGILPWAGCEMGISHQGVMFPSLSGGRFARRLTDVSPADSRAGCPCYRPVWANFSNRDRSLGLTEGGVSLKTADTSAMVMCLGSAPETDSRNGRAAASAAMFLMSAPL
jgi:hypothetical protein